MYLGGDSDSDGLRIPHQDWRPPDRGRYPDRGGRPPDQGGHPGRGPPDGGGPPGPPGGQGPPGPQGPPRPVRPIIVQTPQVTLDTPTLENTLEILLGNLCYNWPEPKIRLTDSCNNIFSRGRQICKPIQGPYSNWLHQPIKETLIIYLQVYPYMMEVIGRVSFPGLNV